MKFLVDECLHTSLVDIADQHGHEGCHVNWLGLSGTTDWGLMSHIIEEDFTFVTNNAADFRKLYGQHELHAGLVIIVPQVAPAMQRSLFIMLLDDLISNEELVNEVIEITIVEGEAIFSRYTLPEKENGG